MVSRSGERSRSGPAATCHSARYTPPSSGWRGRGTCRLGWGNQRRSGEDERSGISGSRHRAYGRSMNPERRSPAWEGSSMSDERLLEDYLRELRNKIVNVNEGELASL